MRAQGMVREVLTVGVRRKEDMEENEKDVHW